MTGSIPGVDMEKGLANMAGDEELYNIVLAAYAEEEREHIAKLISTKDSDLTNFVVYAHAAKSSSNNIGAIELGEKARLLEFAGKEGDTAYIEENLNSFLAELKEMINNVEAYLG